MPAREHWDAVVIGAGPAGGFTALELARAGGSVLLLEKHRFPREKVCGCCLNAAALGTLRRAGLGDRLAALGGGHLSRLVMRSGRRVARLRLPAGCALSRPALDGMLVEAAKEAGAVFRDGSAARVRAGGGPRHHVAIGDAEVSTDCVVVADGLTGTSLSQWPALAVRTRPDARVGLGVHVPAGGPLDRFLETDAITMLCGRHGYLGLVRLENGTIDLAAAADRSVLRAAGGPAGLSRDIAADAGVPLGDARAWPWRMTPPLTRHRACVSAPGLYVVGDAAGYVEPFTGEGMAWALAGGAAVARLAGRGAGPRAWARAHRRVVTRRQRGCRVVAGVLRRPRLTRAAVAVLSAVPALATPLVPAWRTAAGEPA